MKKYNRAAQFALLAALTRYDMVIREMKQISEEKRIFNNNAIV